MKKALLILSVAAVILSACNSGEKYTLKPNLKAGDSYALEYKVNLDQDIMGMNNKMLMNMGYQMKVKEVNAQQDIDLDFMYNRIGMNMKSAMFSFSFDSDSTHTPSGINMDEKDPEAQGEMMKTLFGSIFGQLINKPIQVTLDATGKVKSVKGYREIIKAIEDSVSSVSPGKNTNALESVMNEDQINQVFQQVFGTFSKKPVGIGETWTNDINMSQNGMPMKYTNTYKILEILKKENEAIVDVNGTISMGIGNNDAMKKMNMDVKGTQKGKLTVDLNTGLIKDGKLAMDIKIDMEAMGQKVPMTMKGSTVIVSKKL